MEFPESANYNGLVNSEAEYMYEANRFSRFFNLSWKMGRQATRNPKADFFLVRVLASG